MGRAIIDPLLNTLLSNILHEETLKIIIPFPSSSLCKMGFSAVAFLNDKYKNRLDAEHPRRLALSDVEPQF